MATTESPLVQLARQTIEMTIRHGKAPPPSGKLSGEIQGRAGVFVSIKKFGDLRGCIGTFDPVCPTIIEEVIQNAISAATRDPRFPPVEEEELQDLDISVDVLTTPEPVSDASGLDPKRYGVIVTSGWRKGLLLPDLEGVDTVEQQIGICRLKAGIEPDDEVELCRFEVKRHK